MPVAFLRYINVLNCLKQIKICANLKRRAVEFKCSPVEKRVTNEKSYFYFFHSFNFETPSPFLIFLSLFSLFVKIRTEPMLFHILLK